MREPRAGVLEGLVKFHKSYLDTPMTLSVNISFGSINAVRERLPLARYSPPLLSVVGLEDGSCKKLGIGVLDGALM